MTTDQQFNLRWHDHKRTLMSSFETLLEQETLVDCTLAAEGQYLKAHRVVLSACSPYFEVLLSQHYEKHPIIILIDVTFKELKQMIDYIYRGEVTISQNKLQTFVNAAKSLQIKGLSDNMDDAGDVGADLHGDTSGVSGEENISPSPQRKRKKTQRFSQENGPDFDTTNNSYDLPKQSHLQVHTSTLMTTPAQHLKQNKQQVKQKQIIGVDNIVNSSVASENGLLEEKYQPPTELPLEPKSELTLEYIDNEVEDLTLDDDDEEEIYTSFDASRPGPSHGDMSSEGYPPRMIDGDHSATDEFFMALQDTLGSASKQQQDSTGRHEWSTCKRGIGNQFSSL